MLINYYIGISAPFIAGLAVIILFAWLWKKMKKKPVAGGTIGFFVGMILAAFLFVTPTKVYVVTGNKEMSKYISVGGGSYTLKNGTKVDINAPMANCTLINDSDEDVVLEHVIYGFGFQEDDLIESGQALLIDDSYIDYFFDETPPDEIETTGSGTFTVCLWLRMAADYENTHIQEESFDNIRNLLQEEIDERNSDEETMEAENVDEETTVEE